MRTSQPEANTAKNLPDALQACLALSSQELEAVLPLFTTARYAAGQHIFRMGERADFMGLVLKGFVRAYYLDADGNDVTKCFSQEGQWCGFYNYITTEPSPVFIEAQEDVLLAKISVEAIHRLREKNPALNEKISALINAAFIQTDRIQFSFTSMNAAERYESFIKENPSLCRRAKQEHIATYLGITPSSLSRIKREHNL